MTFKAEYIWLDGALPVQQLRSKTRILPVTQSEISLESFPDWGYDGSSTAQADGGDSDLALKPVYFCKDPLRGEHNYLVMCEVFNGDNTPHSTNIRSKLREVLENGGNDSDVWFGFEQEYTLFKHGRPLGFPETGYPEPQGPYYCGVGSENIYGREIVEEHTEVCEKAGLMIFGTNAEVMPGQWEFQLGYRGDNSEDATALSVSDQVWVARWLLIRIAESHGVKVSFECKPMKGDWNGAGMHTNFSTNKLRDPSTGRAASDEAIELLSKRHSEHISAYGFGLDERLTGLHETCSISEFRAGVADRGASIRVPRHISEKGCGYLEDRRPGANANPYAVSKEIVATICQVSN